jgi:hypothetical protein
MDGLSVFIREYLSGPHQHALGEAVYKIVRFNAKRDPQDLVKASAWTELVWNADQPADMGVMGTTAPPSFGGYQEVASLSPRAQRAVDAASAEIVRAIKMHGEEVEVFTKNHPRAFLVLCEEVGELAQALLEDSRSPMVDKLTGSGTDAYAKVAWTFSKDGATCRYRPPSSPSSGRIRSRSAAPCVSPISAPRLLMTIITRRGGSDDHDRRRRPVWV